MTEEKKTNLPAIAPGSSEIVEYNSEQMDVIKKHLAPNCSDIELQFLVEKSKACGMNVIKNECYFVPANQWDGQKRCYVTKWSVQTSIDFYRKRGVNTKNIEWYSSVPYYLHEEKDGTLRELVWRNVKKGKMPAHPDFARALIKRKDMTEPIEHVVYWNEYAKVKKDGSYMAMWGKMPGLMLCKVAEAGCWRKAVPELSGVYTSDEMPPAIESSGRSQKQNISNQIANRATKRIEQAETVEDVETVVDEETPEAISADDKKKIDQAAAEKKEEIAQEATDTQPAPNPTKSDGEKKSEAELMASILMELSQCQTAEEVGMWHDCHKEDFGKLSDTTFGQINSAKVQRLKELEPEKKEPDNPLKDSVAQEAKEEIAAEKEEKKEGALISDNALRLVMKICYTIEDQNQKPYIKDHDECYRFIGHLFKSSDVKKIKMVDATRFIATFNNFKDPKKLLELFCKFKNVEMAE